MRLLQRDRLARDVAARDRFSDVGAEDGARLIRLDVRPQVDARAIGEKGGAVCENRPCKRLALLGFLSLLRLLRHCSLLMGGDSA